MFGPSAAVERGSVLAVSRKFVTKNSKQSSVAISYPTLKLSSLGQIPQDHLRRPSS
jgi:hypothetical protein